MFKLTTDIALHDARVTIMWILGHLNIAGNELADSTARQATNSDVMTEFPYPLQI